MTPKEMTQKERQALIQDLEDSRDSLLRTVNGIDEKMWQAKQVVIGASPKWLST